MNRDVFNRVEIWCVLIGCCPVNAVIHYVLGISWVTLPIAWNVWHCDGKKWKDLSRGTKCQNVKMWSTLIFQLLERITLVFSSIIVNVISIYYKINCCCCCCCFYSSCSCSCCCCFCSCSCCCCCCYHCCCCCCCPFGVIYSLLLLNAWWSCIWVKSPPLNKSLVHRRALREHLGDQCLAQG